MSRSPDSGLKLPFDLVYDLDMDSPKPTGRVTTLDITGYLLPMEDSLPCLLSVPGSEVVYLPIFSTREKLDAVVKITGIQPNKVVTIEDPQEFMKSVLDQVEVMCDPHSVDGKIRWHKI